MQVLGFYNVFEQYSNNIFIVNREMNFFYTHVAGFNIFFLLKAFALIIDYFHKPAV